MNFDFNQVKDFLAQNPALMTGLLAGGGSALAGGALTSMSPEKQDEDRATRRKRILRNALLSGLVGGGAAGLLTKGVQNLGTALPADDKDFVTNAATGPLARLGAVGGVGAGLFTHGRMNEAAAAKRLASQISGGISADAGDPSLKMLRTTLKDALNKGKPGEILGVMRSMFDTDGIPLNKHLGDEARKVIGPDKIDDAIKQINPHIYNPSSQSGWKGGVQNVGRSAKANLGRYAKRIIGNTPGGRALRIGALGTAAMFPEVIKGVAGTASGVNELGR